MTLIERYVAAWRTQDADAILATLTPDCVVTESFGPVYHGHAWVRRWVAAWIADGGRVIDWTVAEARSFGTVETARWTFHYALRGEEKRFDGATLATLRDGRIAALREYATTAPLYDWRGAWRAD